MATSDSSSSSGKLSYMWGAVRDVRDSRVVQSVATEYARARVSIGDTYQSILYSGWSTQSAERSSYIGLSEPAEHETTKEPEKEQTKDGPVR